MMRRALPVFLLAGLLWGGALGRDALNAWIDRTSVPAVLAETGVEVSARDGTLLRVYTVADGLWRLEQPLDGVDPLFLDMLLTYEDRRFPDHPGVDLFALARAAAQALWSGRIVSGGSTLTMQLARLIEDGPTGQWPGKLRQARLALALERQLTKDQILQLYLLHAPYGGNLEGVRAASLAWFGKPPARLSPAEAALLVALPQAPEGRRPDRAPEAARFARARVLQRAAAAGLLDDATRRRAEAAPLPRQMRAFPALAPHLTDRAVAENPLARTHTLTLDAPLQTALEQLALQVVRPLDPRVSVAMVVMDHQTGEVLAHMGAPGLAVARGGFVDMTRAVRSPGSTLKPLIYGLGFDQGLGRPGTLITDRPTRFGRYAPQNFDNRFRGEVTMAEALTLSLNLPVVKLLDRLGPARLDVALRAAGLTPRLPKGGAPGLAMALGGVGLTLEELTTLYAGFGAGGVQVKPVWRMAEAEADLTPGQRFLAPEATWMVTDILRDIPPPPHAPRGLAYKTGTSYGHRDTWAIGYDGAHAIGIWMGRPDGTPVPGAFGASVAAPVLFEAFARLKPRFVPFPAPEGVNPAMGHAIGESLPLALRHFDHAGRVRMPEQPAAQIAFPPDGAVLAGVLQEGVTLKLRGGVPPYMVLVNGAPQQTGLSRTEVTLPALGLGFQTLSVVDSQGRGQSVTVELR